MLKKNNGFTLIELVVVIAIIGILAGVLVPSLVGYMRKAEEASAMQEANPYINAYGSWILEKDRLGYNVDTNTYMQTNDRVLNSSKTYYRRSTNTPYVYTKVDSPVESFISEYYEVKTAKKSFSEYCVEEIGISVLGTLVVDGNSNSSTGFTYTSKDGKYAVTYTALDGKIEANEVE